MPPADIRMVSAVPASARDDAPWSDHDVEGFYGRIAVRETRGDGLPLVLIHGEASGKDVFRLQMIDALGARYRMLAIDLPGHGGSDAPAGADACSLTSLADAVIDTLERLGIERFALLGWSLGGHVALEVAAAAPGAAGVMVVGTPLGAVTGASPAVSPMAWAPASVDAGAGVISLGHGATNVEALRRSDVGQSADVFGAMVAGMTVDQRSLASSLAVPLAIVNGANDPITQHGSLAASASSSLWEQRQHVFPLAGRAPFLDAPEIFNATLARFLRHLESEELAGSRGLCLAG